MLQPIKAFVPSRRVAWSKLPPAPDRSLSCAGDFADPALNVELRRFLLRDIVPVTMAFTTVGWSAGGLVILILTQRPGAGPGVILLAILIAVQCLSSLVATLFMVPAYFCMRYDRPAPSLILLASGVVFAVGYAIRMASEPVVRVVACGNYDFDIVDGVANATAAVADRQQYCIETINPWLCVLHCSVFNLVRLYPQHGVPLIVAVVAAYACCYGLRPASTLENPYEASPSAAIVDVAFQMALAAVVAAFCVRFHGTSRERFTAAADAERARQHAIAEMREVDGLLQRALPPTVLERMLTVGVEIRDEADCVAVGISDIAGFADFAQREGERAAVVALQELVTAADEVLKDSPNVEKIKTMGDSYCVVSGLPEAFDCHASAACRFGRALVEVAGRLAASTDNSASDAGWHGAALRLRVGVHCGKAFGSVLGTQRLSYEVYGDALDGAQVAVRQAPPSSITITDAARKRLSTEATLFAADADSTALFASSDDVDQATVPLLESDALFRLITHSHSGGIGGGGRGAAAVLVRLARGDTASVCTHSVMTGFVGNGSDVGEWTAGRMLTQRAGLEQRLEFILQLAEARQAQLKNAQAQEARTTTAARAGKSAPGRPPPHAASAAQDANVDAPMMSVAARRRRLGKTTRTNRDNHHDDGVRVNSSSRNRKRPTTTRGEPDEAGAPKNAAATPAATAADDTEATKLLAMMEDAADGPFKRGSRVPLVFSFADKGEERGYIEWVRDLTHTMRRDMRLAAAALYAVVLFGYVATADVDNNGAAHPVVTCIFALALVLGITNAALLVRRRGPRHVDAWLSHLAFFVLAAGVLVGRSMGRNTVVNDPWWLFPVHTVIVDVSVLSITVLTRTVLSTAIIALATASLLLERQGDYMYYTLISLTGLLTQPMFRYLIEAMWRRAYIERRLGETLAAQQRAARSARATMLHSVVPPHMVVPLRARLFDEQHPGSSPAGMVVVPSSSAVLFESNPIAMVCHIDLLGTVVPDGKAAAPTQGEEGGAVDAAAAMSLLDAHRALDALLDQCVGLTKVRMSARHVLVVGPLSGGGAAADAAPQARAVAALGDAMFLLASLAELGVVVSAAADIGELAGAVIGNVRLSYDVFGATVETAEQLAAAVGAHAPPREHEDTSFVAGRSNHGNLNVAFSRRALLMAQDQQPLPAENACSCVPSSTAAAVSTVVVVVLSRTAAAAAAAPMSCAEGASTVGVLETATAASAAPTLRAPAPSAMDSLPVSFAAAPSTEPTSTLGGDDEWGASMRTLTSAQVASPVAVTVSATVFAADVRGRGRVDAHRVMTIER